MYIVSVCGWRVKMDPTALLKRMQAKLMNFVLFILKFFMRFGGVKWNFNNWKLLFRISSFKDNETFLTIKGKLEQFHLRITFRQQNFKQNIEISKKFGQKQNITNFCQKVKKFIEFPSHYFWTMLYVGDFRNKETWLYTTMPTEHHAYLNV